MRYPFKRETIVKISQLTLENPFILAPLAGITNLPFRQMVKACGCGLVCSEMISANGLVYDSPRTMNYLKSVPDERPISFQIFGSKPDIMAEAAKIVASSGADILDINLGCSVRKVLKTGSGAALMKNDRLAETIFLAVRKAVDIPFTIKIRSGWDPSGDDAIQISQIAENCGVDAIAVHPRTATQGFGGQADWSIIEKVKSKVNIPVIGNGDVDSPEKAFQMMDSTGCDGVMIGRAAVNNPWIFRHVVAKYNQLADPEISMKDKFNTISDFVDQSIAHMGERVACRLMRSRLAWFSKGLPNSVKFRESIRFLETRDQVQELLWDYFHSCGFSE